MSSWLTPWPPPRTARAAIPWDPDPQGSCWVPLWLAQAQATAEQRREFAVKIQKNPRGYIAQPVVSLSRVPTIVEDHFEGRHVDLRPFILSGDKIVVTPGALTRVALRKGSLVVNSSQGGGSKDTWVLSETKGDRS